MTVFSLITGVSLDSRGNTEICTRVFGPNSHPFYQYLISETAKKMELEPSVVYEGINTTIGKIGFRQRTKRKGFLRQRQVLAWESKAALVPGTATRQGDVRFFIFLAGQELAQKFGFDFVSDENGVALLAPTAALIEQKVLALNKVLTSQKKEVIGYLPTQHSFAQLGETLKLSNESRGDIVVRFPYADLDSQLAAHEIAYHLGSLLYPLEMLKKSSAINLEVARVAQSILELKLPKFSQVSRNLIEKREMDLDAGNGNLQVVAAGTRIFTQLAPYSNYNLIADSHFHEKGLTPLVRLAHPFYTPSEVVALALIGKLGLTPWFDNIAHLAQDKDFGLAPGELAIGDELKLTQQEKILYVDFVKELLRTQDQNPLNAMISPRREGRVWLQQFQKGLDARIKELLEAFAEIEKSSP